jgi:D-alanyl-D-alanine carboxypeptidase
MRANDRFRIGSVTKTYVATVALQLVAERRLTLMDTVARWLPGLVPNGEHITIRELLNHSSGIPEFDQDPRVLKPYLSGHLAYHWTPRALVKIAVSHRARFAPGTRYSYSNTNYLLVGMVIEAVTGESLSRELEQRLFRPLHLAGLDELPHAAGACASVRPRLLHHPQATSRGHQRPEPVSLGGGRDHLQWS